MSAFNESGSSDLAIYFGDFLSTIAAFTMPAMADSVLVARQQVTAFLSNEGSWTNHAPTRARKLLLNRQEISKIENKLKESGLTLIPLSLYFNDGKAKVEIAVARGRKNYDKRQAIAEKDAKRETQRATGRRDKGME